MTAAFEGGVVLAEGKSGCFGIGKACVGFGVWFYFPLHKVILNRWWCDGTLPEFSAPFLQEILCLAKCLGESEVP